MRFRKSDGKEGAILHLYPKNVYLGAGLQEPYAGRKNRNADPNLSVRSRNIHNTDPAGSQNDLKKRGAGTKGVL